MTQNRSRSLGLKDLFFPDMTGWGLEFELELCGGTRCQIFQHIFIASPSLIFLRGINKQYQQPLRGHEAHLNSSDNYFLKFVLWFFQVRGGARKGSESYFWIWGTCGSEGKTRRREEEEDFQLTTFFLRACFEGKSIWLHCWIADTSQVHIIKMIKMFILKVLLCCFYSNSYKLLFFNMCVITDMLKYGNDCLVFLEEVSSIGASKHLEMKWNFSGIFNKEEVTISQEHDKQLFCFFYFKGEEMKNEVREIIAAMTWWQKLNV